MTPVTPSRPRCSHFVAESHGMPLSATTHTTRSPAHATPAGIPTAPHRRLQPFQRPMQTNNPTDRSAHDDLPERVPDLMPLCPAAVPEASR